MHPINYDSVKRAMTLSFLLLANIILLVHAVIPHHHHDLVCCSPNAHCDDNDETHEHTADSGCQQHDDENKGKECPLKDVYMKPENDKSLVDLNPHNDLQYPVLLLFPVKSMVKITDLKNLPFRQKPCLLFYYTDYLSQSLGLRAPPVC